MHGFTTDLLLRSLLAGRSTESFKMATSSGWRWLVCGGNSMLCILFALAFSIRSMLMCESWLSIVNSGGLLVPQNGMNSFSNQFQTNSYPWTRIQRSHIASFLKHNPQSFYEAGNHKNYKQQCLSAAMHMCTVMWPCTNTFCCQLWDPFRVNTFSFLFFFSTKARRQTHHN